MIISLLSDFPTFTKNTYFSNKSGFRSNSWITSTAGTGTGAGAGAADCAPPEDASWGCGLNLKFTASPQQHVEKMYDIMIISLLSDFPTITKNTYFSNKSGFRSNSWITSTAGTGTGAGAGAADCAPPEDASWRCGLNLKFTASPQQHVEKMYDIMIISLLSDFPTFTKNTYFSNKSGFRSNSWITSTAGTGAGTGTGAGAGAGAADCAPPEDASWRCGLNLKFTASLRWH